MKCALMGLFAIGTAGMAATGAHAEPLKIALVETLSGGQAVTGKLFQAAIKFALTKLEKEKPWPDGVVLLEYDNQGGAPEAADKVKAAITNPPFKYVSVADQAA
jgi:branched-chain amino acid transport system substrate-binding protein